MLKTVSNLSFFIWTHELLPLDILLLALIDRDDDPHALRIVVCILWSINVNQVYFLFFNNILLSMFHLFLLKCMKFISCYDVI